MMKFGICLLTLIVVGTYGSANAQYNGIRAGYYGESITHYGLSAGYEHAFRESEKTKKENLITKQWLYSGNLAVYRHPHNHIGVILSPELAWRRTAKKGRFIEAAIAPSLFRYFYEGSTYQTNEQGGLEKITLAGRTAFLPTLSLGFGKDLSVKRNIPWMWYGRLNLMREMPYNASALTRVSIGLGVIRKIS